MTHEEVFLLSSWAPEEVWAYCPGPVNGYIQRICQAPWTAQESETQVLDPLPSWELPMPTAPESAKRLCPPPSTS